MGKLVPLSKAHQKAFGIVQTKKGFMVDSSKIKTDNKNQKGKSHAKVDSAKKQVNKVEREYMEQRGVY